MFGSSRFKWVNGEFYHLGHLEFPTTLDLSDADVDTGTVKRGKLMAPANNSVTAMAYAEADTFMFLGFLTHEVNRYGTTDATGFKAFTIGQQDLPLSRGSEVTLRVPIPGALIELEGVGAAGYDQLVVTTGTGALSTSTGLGTPLAATKGGIYAAQAGDFIIGYVRQANMTPENVGEVRIRFQSVAPQIYA